MNIPEPEYQLTSDSEELLVKIIEDGRYILIACLIDGGQDPDYWLNALHPLEIIDAVGKNGHDMVDPPYRAWCRAKYAEDGILRLKNATQVAILKPGSFKVETYENPRTTSR